MGAKKIQGLTYKARSFLAAFARCGSLTNAARAAGVSLPVHYQTWLKWPEYVEAFHLAEQEAAEALEIEARRRAAIGVREPVYWQGRIVGWKRVYSDSLLMFLLRGSYPSKYRDRTESRVESVNANINLNKQIVQADYSQLTDEELVTLESLFTKLGVTEPNNGAAPHPGRNGTA